MTLHEGEREVEMWLEYEPFFIQPICYFKTCEEKPVHHVLLTILLIEGLMGQTTLSGYSGSHVFNGQY